MRPSKIALVVPNGRDEAALARTIAPLDLPDGLEVQVIVGRHRARPLQLRQTRELGLTIDVPVAVVYSDRLEPPCLRNAALEAVADGHVLFLDDDVIPSASLLHAAAELIRTSPSVVHQGPPFLTANDHKFLARLEGALYERSFASYVDPTGRVSLLDARILLAPREALARCPFDDTLAWGGEGRDLAARMIASGVELRLAPSLQAKHLNRDTLPGLILQKRAHGFGRGAILRRNGPGHGGWGNYAKRYLNRHFWDPIRDAVLGRLSLSDATYTLVSNLLFWMFAAVNYAMQSNRRRR